MILTRLRCLQSTTQRGWLSNADGSPKMALILALAAEIATGMEYLHIHGIIHGGLHPTQSASAPTCL